MWHMLAAFFKLPTQEFSVKVGVMVAGIVQLLALVFLLLILFKFDGPSVEHVIGTLEVIALGNTIAGGTIGVVHTLRNSAPPPVPASAQGGQ